MRNVAVITTSYPNFHGDPSGHFVETEALELSRSARVVVVTAGLGPGARDNDEDGVRVIRLDGHGAFGWPGVAARLRDKPSRLLALERWLRQSRATLRSLGPLDHVIAHWALPCALPVASGLCDSLEIVSHGGDIRLLTGLPRPLRIRIVRRLLGHARRWRFVSESLRDELAATLLGPERERLLAVSEVRPAKVSFPDVQARASILREATLGEGHDRIVVCVGRLVPSKAWERALDHFARETDRGRSACLVVVGDGPERPRLEAQARSLAIEARFVGKTTRTDALAWIGAADAVLHASQKEGLSTVLREAEALGTPVVFVG